MFTGLIEEVGCVDAVRRSPRGVQISVRAKATLHDLKIGESIAVNGVCLTAIKVSSTGFCADLSDETIRVTTLASLQRGEKVNLERALRASDRLGGHIVSGHVDGTGIIQSCKEEQNSLTLTLSAAPSLLKYCVPKGAIAVDGVSLTVVACNRRFITVVIIPHTAQNTNLGIKREKTSVNLEVDPIGKYVEGFLQRRARSCR